MYRITFSTREEWLAARFHGIGASDSARLYESPLALWAVKTGAVPESVEQTEAMSIGAEIEPAILGIYGRRRERVVVYEPLTSYFHPRLLFMRASIDGWQCDLDEDGKLSPVEIKNVGHYNSADWKDAPPLHYQVQVQHQLAVTGCKSATIVALIGGNKLVWHDVPRNEEFIADLEARITEFWECVTEKRQPNVDSSELCQLALKRLYPRDTGETVAVGQGVGVWLDRLTAAKETIKEAEGIVREAENHLIDAIGTAARAELPDGRSFTYKLQQRAEYVCKATEFRVLRTQKAKA